MDDSRKAPRHIPECANNKILRLNGCTREPQTEWQEPMILLNNIGLLTITHTRSIEYVDNALADAASNNQPTVTEYMPSVYTHK